MKTTNRKPATETTTTHEPIPAFVFQAFIKLDKSDKVDLNATGSAFAAAVEQWYSAQAKVRPAIVEAVQAFAGSTVAAGNLAVFVCAKLGLAPTAENQDLVREAASQMADAGKLIRATDEKGAPMRGRGAGYTLPKA